MSAKADCKLLPPPLNLFLTDTIKMDSIPTQTKWKIHAPFILYFKFWRYSYLKICKRTEQPDLFFLVVFISFYISKYHFSQIFRTSFSIIGKKDFCHKFSFLTDSFKPPHPLNSQNLLSVTKVFCQCSLKNESSIYCLICKNHKWVYLILLF